MACSRDRFRTLLLLMCLLLFVGCASFNPRPTYDVRFRNNAQAQYDEDVRITVAVPAREESRALFGVDLSAKGIQPVWVKVENHGDKVYHLMFSGVDPNHFSPLEAAYLTDDWHSSATKKEMAYYFRGMKFKNPIPPNAAVSGFVFTNLDEGRKVVPIDLVGVEDAKFFTFIVEVPGFVADYLDVDFERLYTPHELIHLDEDGLRTALEELPCCTTNHAGTRAGDPLNLVFVGDRRDIAAAFARRGWFPTEEVYSKAVWKTIKAFIFRSRYRYSPISPLYTYARGQDIAGQKPRRTIHQRNHLRMWMSPMRFQGMPVWISQISRDIGVRFTLKTWPPVTHKIDPNVDDARNALIEDLILSQRLEKVGFVKGVGGASPEHPRYNLTGDPYVTDGRRAVLVFGKGPVSLSEIQMFDWEMPEDFAFRHLDDGAD